ncbi:hypothetical protein LZ575_08130 [Antarcticibacterium sp. 1MA-6-2]|uniref:hypothetical protein n=1 Tax=Antarcticibacterium sp. 1MA-6-2 TaxID=2908210 RepID=UPI001F472841|nr:hypothetical protein [Antarcticibacterium sp. 1MA-6-2]UJH92454.1 hypothetical protein LZ575_08130 [Antarcticibacterium sp. 1MA-6-2]
MTSIEKIIKRIEKGDAVSILAEDSLVQILNELLKYEFIDLVGDKLVVTHKGREASLIGIDKVLSRL